MNYANIFGVFPKSPTIYFLKIPNSPAILSLDSPPVLRNTVLKVILCRPFCSFVLGT